MLGESAAYTGGPAPEVWRGWSAAQASPGSSLGTAAQGAAPSAAGGTCHVAPPETSLPPNSVSKPPARLSTRIWNRIRGKPHSAAHRQRIRSMDQAPDYALSVK